MLGRLLAPLASRPGRVLGLMGLLLLAGPLANFHPLVWRYLVDEVLLGGRSDMLVPAVLFMIAVHLLGSLLGTWTDYQVRRGNQELGADLRARLHRRLLDQAPGFHQRRPSGDLLARAIGDVDVVVGALNALLGGLANSLANLLWLTGVLLWLHPGLALVSFLPVLLAVPLSRAFNRRAEPVYRAVRDRTGELSQEFQEDLQGVSVVRAFGRSGDRAARLRRGLDRTVEASLDGTRAQLIYVAVLANLGFLTNAAIAGVGIWMIMRGWLTLGTLVAFRGYWGTLYAVVQGLGGLNDVVQRGLASAGRIFEILDEPLAVPAPLRPLRPSLVTGRLRIQDVSLAYPGGGPVLRDLDLIVPPGEHIGIVGPSGAGKSSLLRLLLRFRDPDRGRILLDGVDLRDLDPQVLRRAVAWVPQEPFLFRGSLAENLRLGKPDASDAELLESLERARARDFVEALPEGLATRVGERGTRLSGGQRQRLCIARAFLADPKVLLLDEATSAVEPEAAASIRSALESLMKGRTTVCVSHRMSDVRRADRILVVEGGEVREQGSHPELLAAGGWYARMWGLQGGAVPEKPLSLRTA